MGDTTRPDSSVIALPGPAAPSRVGPFEVERELARGGMGVVYVARHARLGRRVALKVVRSAQHAGPEERERFRFEAEAAGRLKHPNIVAVHEVGETDDGTAYFAMDLVEGASLHARLAKGPLAPRAAADVLAKVARAVHFAHQRALLHRDLKPHNIILDALGEPFLTDFGLAKDVGAPKLGPTVTGEILGTPAYMAPEQANGDPARIDRRADVYGLGATLYAALTGKPPFESDHAIGLLAKVLQDEPAPPSRRAEGIDRDLETICLRCLEKEPPRRYETAAALADDLERWLRHEPIVARRTSPLARAAKAVRRNRALSALTVVTLLAAPVGVALERGAAGRQRREAARARFEAALARADAAATSSAEALADARLAARLEVLEEAQRWAAEAQDDAARTALRGAALRLGDEAVATRAWSLVEFAYPRGRGLGDDAAVDSALAAARDARGAEARRQRAEVTAALGRAREAAPVVALARLDAVRDAVLVLVRWPTAATIDLLLERLAAATAALTRTRALPLPDALEATAIATALGRLDRQELDRTGRAAAIVEALGRHLEAELAAERVDEPRAAVAVEALARLGGPRAAELLDRARPAFQSVHFPEALARARPELSRTAQDPLIERARGLVRLDAVEAVRLAREALARAPDDPKATATLGFLLLRVDAAEALRVLERAAALAPGLASVRARLALAQYVAERLDEAEANANHAVELDPDDTLALAVRAQVHHRRGRLDRALQDAERALALDPDLTDALVTRARCRASGGDVEGALLDLDRATGIDPGDPAVYLARASVQVDAGRPDPAILDATRAVALDERRVDGYRIRARAYAAAGQQALARADAERTLELAPHDPLSYLCRALVRQPTDPAGALADAEQALVLDPRSGSARLLRGALRYDAARMEEALEDLDVACQELPGSCAARMRRALALHALGRYDEALAAADEGVRLDPHDAAARGLRGQLLAARGRREAAIADLERSLELAPGDPQRLRPLLEQLRAAAPR